MTALSAIIPARFLIIIAHLTMLLIILFSKEVIIRQDEPLYLSDRDFDSREYNLSVGLYISISIIAIELLSFMTGISIFWPFVSFLSITCHAFGSIALSFFIIDRWQCETFWLIFIFTNIIPIVCEVFAMVGVFALKK